jgi:hypothetical protein
MITVINQFGELLTDNGHFTAEYPDAAQFKSITAAKRSMRLAKQSGRYSAIYYAVTSYGAADSTSVRIG